METKRYHKNLKSNNMNIEGYCKTKKHNMHTNM